MTTVNVEFSGGLEALFNNQKKLTVQVPEGTTIKTFLPTLVEKMEDVKQVDLFLMDGLVRPGVLVLVNDSDWELVGEEDYMVQNNDTLHFASTLHGG